MSAAAATLAEAWAAAVRGNREQAERLREEPDAGDHYAPIAAAFRADPRRTDDTTLAALQQIAEPDDVWVDVGAGAGRFALALALCVREVIAIEPSAGMRAEFEEIRAEHGIENARVFDQRWPTADPPRGNVAMISHVGYDIEPIGAFLDTMERSAARECVAVMYEQAPGGLFHELWPAIHGEPQVQLPGLAALLELLEARGADVSVNRAQQRRWRLPFPRRGGVVRAPTALAETRLSLSSSRLREALDDLLVSDDNETLATPTTMTQGIVRWRGRNER